MRKSATTFKRRPGHARTGFVHRPADILRLDYDNLQCRQCKQAFPEVAEGGHPKADHPGDSKNSS